MKKIKIPDFMQNGTLPEGIHICSAQEFLDKFCYSDDRMQFVKPVSDIFDFAKDRMAIRIIVGGNFVTQNETPNDINCVIIFNQDKHIPAQTECVAISGLKFDILYASLESNNIIESYIKIFSTGLNGDGRKGIIQIDLYDENGIWEFKNQPDKDSYKIIKRTSNDNHLIDINEKAGVLVSIHGLLSRAEWNMDISPIASSQGWIFAPYIYDTNKPDLLFNKEKRAKVVDNFRKWIYDIQLRFDNNISIIAHSFGTYIIAAYLTGSEENGNHNVAFNSLILTNSIIDVAFDWEKYRGLNVGSVYNMIAPNDDFIKYMPESDLKKYFGMSQLFGKSGVDGFTNTNPMLHQSKNEIFNHTNTIKRDVIETKWMPFLNANKNAMQLENLDYLKRKNGN